MKEINARSKSANNLTLEDKIDGEFIERIMHVYAFFTSCLNLVVQNDSEANKLSILQPMIEKHMNDIKLD